MLSDIGLVPHIGSPRLEMLAGILREKRLWDFCDHLKRVHYETLPNMAGAVLRQNRRLFTGVLGRLMNAIVYL